MTPRDSAGGPSSTHQDNAGSRPRTRVSALQRRIVSAAQGRFEGSSTPIFLRRLRALDFVNSIVLFGASLLLSVLPFVILLSSLANHRIDTNLSRHIGLNSQGACIVSHLFRSPPAFAVGALGQEVLVRSPSQYFVLERRAGTPTV